MVRRLTFLIGLIVLVISFIEGCMPIGDEGCTRNVTSVATVNNKTGRDLTLRVCNPGSSQPHNLQVPAQQAGQLSIESHNEHWIKTGGPANACDPTRLNSAVHLASTSFDQVTLCYQAGDASQIAFVDVNQACPTGYIAQTTPVSDSCQ